MPNQYEEIGAAYNDVKKVPFFRAIDASVEAHIGSVQGLRVLDLACGGGYYCRKLLSWDAEHVTGVDISPTMIESAKKLTSPDLPIEYIVADCSQPLSDLPKASFDLVLGVYFLNYASSKQELAGMWENISASLKPGGWFIGIKPTWQPEKHSPDAYGMDGEVVERIPGGFVRRTRVGFQKEVTIFNYVLEWDIYCETARNSGMQDLKVLPVVLPKGEEGSGFWDQLLAEPLFETIEAIKG